MSRLLLLMKVPLHSQQKSLFDCQTEHRILQSRTSPSLLGTAYTMGSAGDIAQGSQLIWKGEPFGFHSGDDKTILFDAASFFFFVNFR